MLRVSTFPIYVESEERVMVFLGGHPAKYRLLVANLCVAVKLHTMLDDVIVCAHLMTDVLLALLV